MGEVGTRMFSDLIQEGILVLKFTTSFWLFGFLNVQIGELWNFSKRFPKFGFVNELPNEWNTFDENCRIFESSWKQFVENLKDRFQLALRNRGNGIKYFSNSKNGRKHDAGTNKRRSGFEREEFRNNENRRLSTAVGDIWNF